MRGHHSHVPARYVPTYVQVDIGLTEEGQERWEDVAALVHAHARLVRELPPEDAQRAWQESRDMSAIFLRFQQASLFYKKTGSAFGGTGGGLTVFAKYAKVCEVSGEGTVLKHKNTAPCYVNERFTFWCGL